MSRKTENAEIERKFLVKQLPEELRRFERCRITQGYLASDRQGGQVRLRQAGRVHSLTIKAGRGLKRQEVEVTLSAASFRRLWPLTAGRRLTKTRYKIPYRRHMIELDVYRGKNDGLVVAEVEFRTARDCASFKPPAWFGRDVTNKPHYSNVGLARE